MVSNSESLSDMYINKKNTPSRSLLFSFIIEIIFTVIVFVVSFITTLGLHYLGSALKITGFGALLWRLFELALISFTTLWCVVFLIRSGITFITKPRNQFNKSDNNFNNRLPHLNFKEVMRRFREPVYKHPKSLVVCSMVIVCFLYIGISFAELVQSNYDDMSILACALICETGPDFTQQTNPSYFGNILESYTKYIEKKHLSVLLKIYPNCSTKEIFSDVNDILVNAKGSQEEVANDIWRAGEEIMLFRLKAPKMLPRRITFHEYRKATKSLLPLAKDALNNSKEASELFNKFPSMENAVHSCERNRLTMLLLFPLWTSYNRPEVASLFSSFKTTLEECKISKINVSNSIQDPNDPRKKFLKEIIAESEQRRLDIISNIEDGDIKEAIERIWDAIEIAYSRRETLLEVCTKIRNARNYKEVIQGPSSVRNP